MQCVSLFNCRVNIKEEILHLGKQIADAETLPPGCIKKGEI